MLPFLKTISAASGADSGFALTDASKSSAAIKASALVFMVVTFRLKLLCVRALFHSRPRPSSKSGHLLESDVSINAPNLAATQPNKRLARGTCRSKFRVYRHISPLKPLKCSIDCPVSGRSVWLDARQVFAHTHVRGGSLTLWPTDRGAAPRISASPPRERLCERPANRVAVTPR